MLREPQTADAGGSGQCGAGAAPEQAGKEVGETGLQPVPQPSSCILYRYRSSAAAQALNAYADQLSQGLRPQPAKLTFYVRGGEGEGLTEVGGLLACRCRFWFCCCCCCCRCCCWWW